MKVKVTRKDIEFGRQAAASKCGCPIHEAIARKLRLKNKEELEIPNVGRAQLGRIRMYLPDEAIEFQERLMKNPEAKVKPFQFETELIAP